jgi:plastocyanin
MLGANYATNSDVAPRYPNEWEFFARWMPMGVRHAWPLDVAAQLGYNLAAESVDGEVTLGRQLGPMRVRVAGRVLSHAFGLTESRTAIAGGGLLRLGRYVAVAADVASVIHRPAGYEMAWSGALQIAIPYTPHTVSLQTTNTNTATLEGSSASRGGRRRYGFEFTIPITVRRFLSSAHRGPARPPTATAATDLHVVMQDDMFAPARIEIATGTAVVWTNNDTRDHTVTDENDGLDSGIIEPGGSWRYVFNRAGTYAIHCTPHPFMTALVVVR